MVSILPDFIACWPSLVVKALGDSFKRLFISGTQADIHSPSDDKQTNPTPPKPWVSSEKEPLHPVILNLTVNATPTSPKSTATLP